MKGSLVGFEIIFEHVSIMPRVRNPDLSITYVLIHVFIICANSAGVGRTGTFIMLDRLLQQLQKGDRTLNVFKGVLELREHRQKMVQGKDQYHYIHLCLAQAIQNYQTSGSFLPKPSK